MQFDSDAEQHRCRRNVTELGIGTNPNAKSPLNLLEAEKIKGTVHVATEKAYLAPISSSMGT
jgi:leucyl aminopeptidase (aminopeptidase T)